MPSPFPGMDPFIEGYEWEDFLVGQRQDRNRLTLRIDNPVFGNARLRIFPRLTFRSR